MSEIRIPGTMKNVTPHDTADSGSVSGCLGLYIGAAGTVVTLDAKGNSATWILPAGGVTLSGHFTRVMETNTTVPSVAGNFVALYPAM